MSKLKRKEYNFNKETGEATFKYTYKGHTFTGKAYTHEDDKDMMTEFIGLELADNRAFVQYLKVRRAELETRLQALQGMYNYLSDDKNFDLSSSYARKFRLEILDTKNELDNCRIAIKDIPKFMKSKIEGRDEIYKKVRARRAEEAK